MKKAKPFKISKQSVWEAWKHVKANQGVAGVNSESIPDFEGKLKDNLYKLWNRMSSGSYLPPPVKKVAIPKKTGGERIFGIPTVSDRIAQMVVKLHFEPLVEPHFHQDSYGYRPERSQGTPQGGVISPVLANLFLHYVFDKWMDRNHPENPFSRYADDAVVHCQTEAQSFALKKELEARFKECGLELHPTKTKIVYCKDSQRRSEYPVTSFDFLGFTFRPRCSKSRNGNVFLNFSPALSNKAGKTMREKVRQ